jgi:hypothetical protein
MAMMNGVPQPMKETRNIGEKGKGSIKMRTSDSEWASDARYKLKKKIRSKQLQ